MKVHRLTNAIGAEIYELDLAAGLNNKQVADLRDVWLEHLVVFIKGQRITPAQQLAFARQIGEPDTYPFLTGLPGFEHITEVLKKEDETINFGGIWHTDTTYQPSPPMATMLYAKELPTTGGDTLFANQYAAFESLSNGLKKTLRTLRGISSAAKKAVAATRVPRIDEQGTGTTADQLQAAHPVVRVHPETGRESLFINPAHTVCFEGWSVRDSEPLLTYLHDQQIREEFTCRFRWQDGDMALWDNRCSLHYPVNDYPGQRRLLHRITLKGDAPQGVGT